MGEYLEIIVVVAIVIVLAKFILNLSIKKLIGLAFNALIGGIIIYIINYFDIIAIPLNIWTSLVVGVLGVPGVIILVILVLAGII